MTGLVKSVAGWSGCVDRGCVARIFEYVSGTRANPVLHTAFLSPALMLFFQTNQLVLSANERHTQHVLLECH